MKIDACPDQLIAFAEAYSSLGWAVQEQVRDLLDGSREDFNPNAIQLAYDRLKGYNEDLDDDLQDWLKRHKG